MVKKVIAKNLPKDVFLHLLNILTFYLSIVSFINLYIQYISALFPDQLSFYYAGTANAVRTFTSILIIAFPAYLLTSWLLGKDLKENPAKREFRLRKWLVYFTLFISAITIIVDLIIFVNRFLGGELTPPFLSKVLVVLLVGLAVFGYHIWDSKRKDAEKSRTPKKLSFAASFIVLASIAAGFFIMGTPAEQRRIKFDEQRISHLQILQSQIINYWVMKESLPQELNGLEDSISGFIAPKDPESNIAYEYNIIGNLSFELCAAFKTLSRGRGAAYYNPRDSFQQNWEHEAERTCFKRIIDPELYKNTSQPKEIVPLR
ncbi:MAG: hypothetical protein HYV47_03855 [Candidatus Nealsonbacteria bacterium]|nr:hypothetical protein [Candidatus Nealsonbacteria bacterium]